MMTHNTPNDEELDQGALFDADEVSRSESTDHANQEQSTPSGKNERVVLEPLDRNPYDLTYSCLLIPRFSTHYLMGDITTSLEVWMKQICISLGWRLEFVNVKPEFLQWTMSVPPSTSASYFMRIIRQQTSLYIFEDYPRFKRKNLSDDFWAPGYLIVPGSQPHPMVIIQRFIRQIRQQYGYSPDG